MLSPKVLPVARPLQHPLLAKEATPSETRHTAAVLLVHEIDFLQMNKPYIANRVLGATLRLFPCGQIGPYELQLGSRCCCL